MTSLVSAPGELHGCRCAQPIRPSRCVLIPAVGRKAKELTLHCVDPGDIGRDEVIAAAFVGQHLKLAAGESRGGASAAKMDEGRNILLLRRACGHVRAGEDRGHIAVQIHGCEFDGMARDRANVGTEPATGISDGVRPDAKPGGLGLSPIGHLEQADGAGGGPVDRERIEAPSPAPIGTLHRIA